MHFILTGFKQDKGYRVFSFERLEADKTTTMRMVRADLTLAQKYDIPLQDLPLLCLGHVGQTIENSQEILMTFTEEDMRLHQRERADARKLALQRKKPVRRPITPHPSRATNVWGSALENKTSPVPLTYARGQD